MNFCDEYNDRLLCMNTVVDTDVIAYVTNLSRKAQVDDGRTWEMLSEAYAQEPTPLNTQDVIRV